MAEDLQARLAQADRPYVDGILAQVNALTSGASREARDREGLLTLMQQVLALVTEPMVLQILSDRLVEITNDSHDDFISVAKPSVARLTFSPAKDEPNLDPYAEPRPIAGGEGTVDDYGDLLEGTKVYNAYQIGIFLVTQNPYILFDNLDLAPNALNNARSGGRGGHLKVFNSEGPWTPGDAGIGYLPKPTDTGSKTWYFETEKKPADIPSPLPSTYATKDKLRNVVKTVEIEYIQKGTEPLIATGEWLVTTDKLDGSTPTTAVIPPTGTTLPGPHIVGGALVTTTLRRKAAHVIICYAGGNGS